MAAFATRLSLLLLSLAAYALNSPAAPVAVSASYDVLRNGFHIAVIKERFEVRGDTYRIVSESSTSGLLALFRRQSVTLVSTGRLIATGLQPEYFEGRDSSDEARRVSAQFDWQADRVTLKHDNRVETLALPRGTQDRLSLMYQLMFVKLDGRTKFDVPMTNGRKLDRYRYLITRDVEIDTPLGRMKTLHLAKERQANESSAEVWLATQRGFFPVRVLIVEKDGTRYDQIVTALDHQQ